MSGLSERILSRFPAHLEAGRGGKLLADVSGALATDLEVLASALGRVRRSHRLGHADELRDVLALGGLNGIGARACELLHLRLDAVRAARDALLAAGDDDARRTAAAGAYALWNVDWAALELAVDELSLYEDPGAPGDLAAAAARLAGQLAGAASHRVAVEAARMRVARICRRHALGNGSVSALIEATALALDAGIVRIQHSEDRFWHAAEVRDLIGLSYEATDGEDAVKTPVPLRTEVMGVEENPLRRHETEVTPRGHAERFTLIRRGFVAQQLEIRVTGRGVKTVNPRVVHRDAGHGVAYVGSVPQDAKLVFAADGRVMLDETDVTDQAYAWQGACFADAGEPAASDFTFDAPEDAAAGFAVAAPFDAFDPGFEFPHAGENLPMPEIAIGSNRFAFWVQEAHASRRRADLSIEPVSPRFELGLFDGSVFADEAEAAIPRADVGFAWDEHEAYALRVWIPARFAAFEPVEGVDLRSRLADFLGRFKAAGVDLRVDYVTQDWTLDEGVLGDTSGEDLLARLRPGTVLNPTSDSE